MKEDVIFFISRSKFFFFFCLKQSISACHLTPEGIFVRVQNKQKKTGVVIIDIYREQAG